MRGPRDALVGATKIVEVEWIDSNSEQGWTVERDVTRRAEDEDYLDCVTVGYLIRESDASVTVALSLAVNHEGRLAGDALTIPKVAIRAIRPLRLGR